MRSAQRGRQAATAPRRGEAGFTLVEILVVITIIGLIMAIVGPRVLNYLGESKVKAAKIQIESFSSALDLYYLCLLYTSPSPRDRTRSRMPSSA